MKDYFLLDPIHEVDLGWLAAAGGLRRGRAPGSAGGRAPTSPSEYFAQLLDRFEQASAAVGGAGDLELEMAGLRVLLRHAGDGLRAGPAGALRASRLLRGVGDPDLTILLFDTASTGIEPPAPLWEPIAAAPGTPTRLLACAPSRPVCLPPPAAGG